MKTARDDIFNRRLRLKKLRCSVLDFWSSVGLRPRLLGAFLLVSLIPLIILFFAQYQIARQNALNLIETSLAQVVEGQQRRLNLELQRLFGQLHLVSTRTQMRISLKAYDLSGEDQHLDLLNRIVKDALVSMDHFVGIWIRNPAGELVIKVTEETAEVVDLLPPLLRSEAVQLQLYWSQGADLPNIWLSGPLSLEEENIGSIHILATMADIYAVLEDFPCEPSGGEAVLLLPDNHQQRKIIGSLCSVHLESNQRFYHLFESADLYPVLIAAGAEAMPVHHHGQIVMLRHLDHGFGDMLVHISPLALADIFWGQMHYLLLMTLFALVLIVVMAFALTRSIARPVRELTKATAVIHYGSTDVRIKERFWGEFTGLTRSFNRAMRVISRRTRELNREIEARRRSQEKLIDLANTDTLTGLINRRFFLEKLREVLSSPGRERQPAALLYLDLDDFKPINDSMGHEAGDLVLQIVAGRIRHLLREGDLAARLGGDEFAMILMKNGGHPLDPDLVVRRVEEQLTLPMTIKNQVISVGCSIGSVRLSAGADPHEVLNRADQEMYRVKHARRKKNE